MSHLQVVFHSRGGNGHIAVGNALNDRWTAQGDGYTARSVDVLGDGMFNMSLPGLQSKLGDMMVKSWDETQMHGKVQDLTSLAKMQKYVNLIGHDKAVEKFVKQLQSCDVEPEKIVSTQPL
ncbi:MAG: hypothetical protein FJZ56_00550 [Chlamydiae bacterium]|nr:hypothetical protein [Chlamydiota bacterium]